MPRQTILVVSDIHYASAAEQLRTDHEAQVIKTPLLRWLLKFYRHHIWLREPMKKNHLLDQFLGRAQPGDWVVANGDYSCDSGFIGVADDASFQSAQECLEKLRVKFAPNFRAAFGDHETGKMSFFGGRGGMRLASFHRAENGLGLEAFWQWLAGNYVLMGVTSSLIALPIFEPDTLPAEREEWSRLRMDHIARIRQAFADLRPEQKVILFCHDPTALPFLWEEKVIRDRLPQLERTIIGHLHSPLIAWKSRLLAGLPVIGFLGNTIKRMSRALRQARKWRDFKVVLCPALAGIELLKDGGYLRIEIDPATEVPARIQRHRIRR
ncbi:MAG: metallophosphoesterase [Verrucomicrobiota bacterium]